MSFERGFADVERAAAAAAKAAHNLSSLTRAMEKAAKEGDLTALDRATDRLDGALAALRQEVANARTAWPMSADEVGRYLVSGYGDELLEAARAAGLVMSERDGRYVAFHPSYVSCRLSEP